MPVKWCEWCEKMIDLDEDVEHNHEDESFEEMTKQYTDNHSEPDWLIGK